MTVPSPLILMILDGWGYSEEQDHNAIAAAETPQWDQWWAHCPHRLLSASGEAVGLPPGQMGNSEVGHMHLGAGRPVPQDFTRINQAIESGDFQQRASLNYTIDTLKKSGKTLHVMGLLSPGGVHSHENHLFAFLALCHNKDFQKLTLHLFLDGRDTPPQSALESIARLNQQLAKYPVGKIASISGRYYAMDRDKHWERIAPVYQLIVSANAEKQYASAEEAIHDYYQQGLSDEFIPPTQINNAHAMEDGDAIFFFNFRADRARQLTEAFLDADFSAFDRACHPELSDFLSMTQYAHNLKTTAVFPPLKLKHTLGQVLADEGLSQLRIAETEKYAHVTFFFNGGTEQVFEEEERILIPSPRIATYDLKPEMSAFELTDAIIRAIHSKSFDVIICNFANADMVGHSGKFVATVRAIEYLDKCMAKIWRALERNHGQMLITADHGNAEKMYDDTTAQAHTAHTARPVPFVYIGAKDWQCSQGEGSLIDIAPTVLALLGIEQPEEMTGHTLLEKTNHA